MKRFETSGDRSAWRVLGGSARSQAALMTLPAGESTGGPDNAHDDSDQWLFVVSGTGKATVDKKSVQLSSGALLLIEAGEAHEVCNTGDGPLVTVNVYAPPEY